jgi:predicted ester cyclase
MQGDTMNERTRRDANKAAVLRFNRDVLERGDEAAFRALVAPGFANRTAPPGVAPDADGMFAMVTRVLRTAFPDLAVEIHDMVAEGDRVTTRKTIRGTHRGALFGIPATNTKVAIDVIDVVRLEEGRYVEHWGMTTLGEVARTLQRGTR